MDRTRIMIADRRPRIRFALCALLKRQPGIEIVGEAKDADDLERQVQAAHPDVVLVDWRLEGLATGDLLADLRESVPQLYVIVLSGRPEARCAALAAGADAFVSKADPPNKLLAALNSFQRPEADLMILAPRSPAPQGAI
jgi:DNA-binding NarL/FixJ family response regulator